jgi:sugar/nucleoside kinase (ribokinase family)
MKKSGYDVLGVGAPIVDQILQVSEHFLANIPGQKGGMEPISYEMLSSIIEASGSKPVMYPGGSASNVIRGLANLGRKCALVGSIGTDDAGKYFLHGLQQLGIDPLYAKTTIPTAQVLSLVTPDGQRTLRSFLGASQEMNEDNLDPTHFRDVRLVHIDGYTLFNKNLTQRAMQYAKEAGAIVSFDLANFEVVETFKDLINDLIKEYVDLLFANEDEASILTGFSAEQSCAALNNQCDIAVVMMGKEGCWVGHQNNLLKCKAYPVKPMDTTGAGDLFASGFIHGYFNKKPLEVCAHYGALTAAAVVQVLGAELPSETWASLRHQME